MKILSFVILSTFSFSAFSIELYSCEDESGKTHYTNLPESSLGADCKPKDHHAVLLQQDYDNLSNIHAKYEELKINEEESLDSINFSDDDISDDSIKSKIQDVFDADKAFLELMEATEDRDDAFTRAIRGRTSQMKDAIDQTKEIKSVIDKVESNTLQ